MGFVKKVLGKVADTMGVGSYDFNPDITNLSPEEQQRSSRDYQAQLAFAKNLRSQAGGYNPLIKTLSKTAQGKGPSLITGQLMQATNRNIAQQMAAAASQRGINPALAARMATQNIADINQEAAFQANQARLAEIQAAREAELAARQAQSGATQAGGQLATSTRGQSYQEMEGGRQSRLDQERMRAGAFEGAQKRKGEFVSNIGQGLGILSDKTLKKDIKMSDKQIKSFLDGLENYSYKYKGNKETNYGVMAQDLEKSDAGDKMVDETPEGKMINFAKGLSTMLSAQAHLNKRLKKLEKKRAS